MIVQARKRHFRKTDTLAFDAQFSATITTKMIAPNTPFAKSIAPSELRWSDSLVVSTMTWTMKKSFDEEFKPSKPKRLYAIGEKPNAAVDPSLPWNKRSRRVRRMGERKIQKMISSRLVGPLNVCSAWVTKGYPTNIEPSSMPNPKRWWMRLRSTWRCTPPRMRSRVRIHSARSCPVWRLSRIILRPCTKYFCGPRLHPYVLRSISRHIYSPLQFKSQCVDLSRSSVSMLRLTL